MKWILICLGSLAGLVALSFLIGSMLPSGHTASRTLRLKRSPDEVWKVLIDYSAMPTWRTDLTKIERMPDANGHQVWMETGGMSLPLEDIESDPPHKLVRRIADPNLPFGGTWTYQITAVADGCTVKITEDGVVRNPIFRLMSRFSDQSSTITGFLEALAGRFSEEVHLE